VPDLAPDTPAGDFQLDTSRDGLFDRAADYLLSDVAQGDLCTCEGEGPLPEPSCHGGVRTTFEWRCSEGGCLRDAIDQDCHFGCAPPQRQGACARLAYSTGLEEDAELCVVTSLDDDPICLPTAGHHVAWHPGNPRLIAYSTFTNLMFTSATSVLVAELDDRMPTELCRLPAGEEAFGSFFLNGGWRQAESGESLVVFMGVPEGGSLLREWPFAADSCLARAPEVGCLLTAGEGFDATLDLAVASRTIDGLHYYSLDVVPEADERYLAVYPVELECPIARPPTPVLEADGVTAVGWSGGREITYVRGGSLYRTTLGEDPVSVADAAAGAWSSGQYAILDFNFDGSVFVATDTVEGGLFLFRTRRNRAPRLLADTHMHPGLRSAIFPSIERFEPTVR
jgi:hypothetical protein